MTDYEWLTQLKCVSLSLELNGHAASRMTAAEAIDMGSYGVSMMLVPIALIMQMRTDNVIWRLQIYPRTPITSYSWFGPTIDSVIRQARLQQ